MKRWSWLNLALIIAVCALALFAYYKPAKTEPEHKLSALKAADATSIKIEIAGNPPFALARTIAGWTLTAPLAARADGVQVQRLLEILDATAKDRFPATGLARYDLNEPPVRVTINQQTFGFGAINQMSREQYVLTQDGIYPVSLRYGTLVPKGFYDVVSRQIFAPDEAPTAFRFSDFAVEQRDGKWQLTPAADLSADDVTRWVDQWRLASALGVLPASSRKPLSAIKVRLKNGTEIALNILQREPELIVARSDQPFEFQLPGEAAKRLLAPPAAEPAAAPANK
jgi:hypothetical protein